MRGRLDAGRRIGRHRRRGNRLDPSPRRRRPALDRSPFLDAFRIDFDDRVETGRSFGSRRRGGVDDGPPCTWLGRAGVRIVRSIPRRGVRCRSGIGRFGRSLALRGRRIIRRTTRGLGPRRSAGRLIDARRRRIRRFTRAAFALRGRSTDRGEGARRILELAREGRLIRPRIPFSGRLGLNRWLNRHRLHRSAPDPPHRPRFDLEASGASRLPSRSCPAR